MDSIHGVSNKRTEIMGMEIIGLETAALHALNSTLINVPINYEKRKTHADQSISIQQPREESLVLERPGQSCEAANNTTWKRIPRPQKSKTNPSHQTLCGIKRAQSGDTGSEEEKTQNEKRSKRIEGKKENPIVDAARQPR